MRWFDSHLLDLISHISLSMFFTSFAISNFSFLESMSNIFKLSLVVYILFVIFNTFNVFYITPLMKINNNESLSFFKTYLKTVFQIFQTLYTFLIQENCFGVVMVLFFKTFSILPVIFVSFFSIAMKFYSHTDHTWPTSVNLHSKIRKQDRIWGSHLMIPVNTC